jgi:hypothetical protein
VFTVETPHGDATAPTEFTVFPVPTLMLESSADGALILSWPDNATGFVLQASHRLGSEANWKALSLPDAQPTVPERIRRADTPANPTRFYRLRRP